MKSVLFVTQKVVLVDVFVNFPIDDTRKELADDTEKDVGPISEMNIHIAFLKPGHTFDTFHSLGTDFSFRQRLNNFAKIGDKSEPIFLKTTTGIVF